MPTDPEYIEQLILEELTGLISPEDSVILKRLLEEDPEAFKIWSDIRSRLTDDYIRSVREDLPNSLSLSSVLYRIRKRKLRNTTIGIAASLIGCIVAWQLFHSNPQPLQSASIHLSSLKIPRGKQYVQVLPDGSTVRLNAGTTIEFSKDFNGRTREISLNGEAYLTIAHQPDRPFLVHLPHSTIKVLGTAFNVNTYDSGKVEVKLKEGAIKMYTSSDSITLKPGEMVTYKTGETLVATSFDKNAPLNWQEGTYKFKNNTLYEISKILERLYDVTMIVDSEDAGNLQFTTTVSQQTPLKNVMKEFRKLDHAFDYTFEKGDSIVHLKYIHILH